MHSVSYPWEYKPTNNKNADGLLTSRPATDLAPVPLSMFRSNWKFDENSKHSSVKYTRPSLSWRVQNIIEIGRVYSKLKRSEFSSNFEFDRICLVGQAPGFNLRYIFHMMWGQHGSCWYPDANLALRHMQLSWWCGRINAHEGLCALSGKTYYHMISWSLKVARFGVKLFQSLSNLTGTSEAALLGCLSNFRVLTLIITPNIKASRLHEMKR